MDESNGRWTDEWRWGGTRARRDADLFYADLIGRPRPRRSTEQEDVAEAPTCGFFGSGTTVVSEALLRDRIVTSAYLQYGAWHDKGKHALLECDSKAFGLLLLDTLAFYIDNPAALTALQNTAVTITASDPDPAGTLMTGSKVAATLRSQVDNAVKDARASAKNATPWSAFWVTAIVRAAAVSLALEDATFGRDKLLLRAIGHRQYTFEAHKRTNAKTLGTYHAFDPTSRVPQRGDIIVQDRQAKTPRDVFSFSDVPKLKDPRETHGDIIIAVQPAEGRVVTLGGNVDDCVRARHYPLDKSGYLAVDETLRFTQEDNWQVVAKLPERTCPDPKDLHSRNTLRIFALLSPVEDCRP